MLLTRPSALPAQIAVLGALAVFSSRLMFGAITRLRAS
jgi:hypothetical protein